MKKIVLFLFLASAMTASLQAQDTIHTHDMRIFSQYYESLAPMVEPAPSSFRLYPNPANNKVTMEFNANNIGIVKVVIYNMQGVVVFEKDVSVTSVGIQSVCIPLLDFIPTGNYIVSLHVDNQSFSKKLIIQ